MKNLENSSIPSCTGSVGSREFEPGRFEGSKQARRGALRKAFSSVERVSGLLAAMGAMACSEASNSEQGGTPAGSGGMQVGNGGAAGKLGSSGQASLGGSTEKGAGGSTGSGLGGGGASVGKGGAGTVASGGAGVSKGGAGASGGGAPSTGSCEPKAGFTLGIHMVFPVSWPGTLGTQSGSGELHLYNRITTTATGTALAGRLSPCGSMLPPLGLTLLVGGGMSLVEIPLSVWDLPAVPDFPSSGVLSGWSAGSSLTTNPSIALVGSSLPDPAGAWPAAYTMLTGVDVDGDGNPGITSVPRTGGGYNQPPVSIVGPKAEKIYLTSRTASALEGELTSCTEASGSARLELFDSHVLGCHTSDGSPCTANQTQFVDDNRTRYTVMPGTFTAKMLSENATCSDVRAALPM